MANPLAPKSPLDESAMRGGVPGASGHQDTGAIEQLLSELLRPQSPIALGSSQYAAMEGGPRKTMLDVAGGPVVVGRGGSAGGSIPRAANTNTSQEEVKAMVPPPLSTRERLFQNYTRTMKPDEVVHSEPVWSGSERLAAEEGISRAEAFAELANGFWQRMGANRYMTPEMARRILAGIK